MCFSLHRCHLRLNLINVDYDNIKLKQAPFNEILVKFTYLVGMIADQNFYHICFTVFYPTASATAYGLRPTAEVCQDQTFGYGRR